MKENGTIDAVTMHADHVLFSSLLRRVVHAEPNEDISDFVLAEIGRNVGADRCYVYRFLEPGKTSMCTNTHEWCADGIRPAIGGQQACDLAALADFNACIMSGHDFMFTGFDAIDSGSRGWLSTHGIQSLIATPLVGGGNKILGFVGFDFVKAPRREFSDRIISNVHEAADLLIACHRLHERDMALQDIALGKNEYEENGRGFERALIDQIQAHQRLRSDLLFFALSKDDIPGLIDLTMRRLLMLTACDYIVIHSVDGDHRILYAGGEPEECPCRCEECAFYKLNIPPVEDADHLIVLNDTKRQTVIAIPSDCPSSSVEAVIVYSDGKPWGGIALHYLNRQRKISEDDRGTLNVAATVLKLALERHSAAMRLKAERDRVIEAEKSRNYFFSSVSHDIRTPLNAIIGFSELLQAGDVQQEDAKRYLKMIVSSGKTLLQLINDVLDLSKMDLGKLEFCYEPTDVGELVCNMVPMFEPMAKARKQTIVADIPDNLRSVRYMIDPHRFRQVLFNFIGNAVKYAGPCTIRVKVAYENGVMTTTVADNGKGVSEEKAKRLMQPFVQADIKNRTEGSGLGLAICKRLVGLANGTVLIETAPGKGFRIRTDVPVAVAPEETVKGELPVAQATESRAPEMPGRILVVDDSPVNRAVLKAMLKNLGITNIELAEDGKAALDLLEKDHLFDLVMSDMWMPVMDGVELVRRIRGDKRLAHLKVCSITADVEARAAYREHGFDALLLKPVTIEKLSEIFSETGFV